MWSVSTATREDTLQGSAWHPGIKTAGTWSLPEGLCQLWKLLQMLRSFNKITAANNSNFTKKVNTVKGTRVNTARSKVVLSAVKGNKGNAVKALAYWVWRPKHKVLDHGNPQQDLKDKGVIDIRMRSRKPALSFMRPFGCPVTILNTIDHLGKFDRKADKVVAGNQSNGFAGTKACENAGKVRVETVRGKDYILAPFLTQDPPFSSSSKDSPDAGFKPSGEEEKKDCRILTQIEEEVYVCQPLGFEDPDFPDKVYKVEKALYGLHQAPRAWYETLSTYLLDNRFQRGKIDKTLSIRRDKMMHKKFQMSSMGELTFFLGLQVKQKEYGIFISQDKYVTEILKKFGFNDVKTANTPMETCKPLLKDADGEDVDEHLYRSMIGSLMYLTSSRPDIMFKESPIPPPTIVPPSTMLSPMFNPQELFLLEELLSPKKQGHNQSFSSTSALPQEFKMGE
ncbi:putative ribonuclease H-like domain-containing protein, partial [Tanacetum coccineum]